MTVVDYLREDGSGGYAECRVPDVVLGDGAGTELIFIFESPHVEELKARVPVVGASGRDALRFLQRDRTQEGRLGFFVQQQHSAGNGRVAIMNVCNVALQAAAFGDGGAPDLGCEGWALIERVRKSSARSISSMRSGDAKAVAEVIVKGLRDRLEALAAGNDRRVVAAGAFAQGMVAALPDGLIDDPLRVPHPSFNQWNRVTNQELPDMVEMRRLFVKAVA
ncbi:hypothetical protein [Gordonia sp. (in: high G+C Gram-positive bacteria)]|uniref:hypothetical protein n=1 Tax=Gordonia sp. (in: high G+C Gram-positive bacteria) TaxID=84139 RepID=UPI003BB6EF58